MAPLPTQGPVANAAANRVQKYYNKASGRMETSQQLHNYRAPAGHNVSSTKQTVKREVTSTSKPAVSFINKSPAEIEATARKIVQSELAANRVPFQQQNTLLGQEQTSALGQHATSYGQLQGTISGLQGSQAASAKTYENYAADAINKASQAAPGAAETAEHLGLKPGEKLPESAQRQQEAARTLLSGIAQSAQGGTTARQEGQANFLTNMQGSAALANTEGVRNIQNAFGRQKQEVLNKEGQLLAKGAGAQANLAQRLFGEQEKLRIAAGGLGVKQQESVNKTITTRSEAARRNAQTKGEGAKINQAAKNAKSLAEYRAATLGEKERIDSANINDKKGKLQALNTKNKIAAEKAGPGGTKISAAQKAKWEGELGYALNKFERGPNIEKKGGGRDYTRIRNELNQGEVVTVGGKEKFVKGKGSLNPVVLNAAEQIFKYHYVNTETKKALAAMGLASEGLSNLLAHK